jgi:hypothetical protein
MKYTIELDDETLEKFYKQMIVQDYLSLVREVKTLKKLPNKKDYQIEDLKDATKYRNALKIMITFYFSHDEAKQIIKGK